MHNIYSVPQYHEALKEIEELAKEDPSARSKAGRRLKELAAVVEAYEKEQMIFVRVNPKR